MKNRFNWQHNCKTCTSSSDLL